MATSDERRDVAKALRDSFLDPTDELEAALLHAFGYTRDDAEYFDLDYGAMLADLIDQPTCEIIRPATPDKFGVCSACGALVNVRDSVANATNYLKPCYCPNCGSRVVRRDED